MATAQELLALGQWHHQAGNLNQAEQIYLQLLATDPNHAEALHLLGVIAHSRGQLARATDCIIRAISSNSTVPAFHHNLGAVHESAGRLEDAMASYRRALGLNPQFAESHFGLGNTLLALGRGAEALASFQQAVLVRPHYPEAHNNLGISLAAQGRAAEAVMSYQQAVWLRPGYAEAHNNMGVALTDLRRLEEAAASFRQALQLQPNYTAAHNNLGVVYKHQGRLDEAVACFREALGLQPGYAEAHNNLGTTLTELGKLDEAVRSYQESLRLRPDYIGAHSGLLLCCNYQPGVDLDWLFAEHRRWETVHGAGGEPTGPAAGHDRDPERRLRIGYVSPDLRRHAVAYFVEPILAHHDRAQVETICYAELAAPDHVTRRLQSLAHGWRSTFGLSDVQVADLVRGDRIDILVDLAGHTANNRLRVFTHRPAPVQVSYLGYFNTTGLTAMDYRLTDAVADPPNEPSRYTEALVRLQGSFCCYAPPGEAPAVAPLPARQSGRVTFGALHTLAKLNDEVVDLWAAILRALPAARLLVARPILRGQILDELRQRFMARGVGAERLDLRAPPWTGSDYLRVYDDIDISLDPFPCSGHTTSCESLWMGVPVLTLSGNRFAGRMVTSVLTTLGLNDWVAASREEYLARALQLAGDVDRLAELRAGLRSRMRASALCDGNAFSRGLEQAYRDIWRRWCVASGGVVSG